jgi:hypothetical protein
MDPSNTPGSTQQPDPSDTLAQIAELLGVEDPTDADGMKTAFAALLETSGTPPVQASDPKVVATSGRREDIVRRGFRLEVDASHKALRGAFKIKPSGDDPAAGMRALLAGKVRR